MSSSRLGIFVSVLLAVFLTTNCGTYNKIMSRKNLVDGSLAYKERKFEEAEDLFGRQERLVTHGVGHAAADRAAGSVPPGEDLSQPRSVEATSRDRSDVPLRRPAPRIDRTRASCAGSGMRARPVASATAGARRRARSRSTAAISMWRVRACARAGRAAGSWSCRRGRRRCSAHTGGRGPSSVRPSRTRIRPRERAG